MSYMEILTALVGKTVAGWSMVPGSTEWIALEFTDGSRLELTARARLELDFDDTAAPGQMEGQ